MVEDWAVATLVLALVTASLPFYLYGAWYILDTEVVTWDVLVHHLKFVVTGLVLTTVPMVAWMLPRLPDQVGGLAVLHAFLGLQAYALLTFALTGIVRIFQVKRQHSLYADPDRDVALDDLHENVPSWRKRLRVGVAGYVVFWIVAYLIGVARFVIRYF
jgi:hypothetical protein